MLKGIPPILSPDLLHVLRAMGHGDEIAIVDANYPAESAGPPVIRLDGVTATEALDSVLTLMPLDTYVDEQAFGMEVVGDPRKREQTHKDFDKLIKKHEPGMKLALIERFAYTSG
jgi:L-fucose mutarotase